MGQLDKRGRYSGNTCKRNIEKTIIYKFRINKKYLKNENKTDSSTINRLVSVMRQ